MHQIDIYIHFYTFIYLLLIFDVNIPFGKTLLYLVDFQAVVSREIDSGCSRPFKLTALFSPRFFFQAPNSPNKHLVRDALRKAKDVVQLTEVA